jgi:hypothetical protein
LITPVQLEYVTEFDFFIHHHPVGHGRSLCKNDYWLSIPLKGYYSKIKYICQHYTLIVSGKSKNQRGAPAKKRQLLRSLIETAEDDFVDFQIKLLSEFEAICKTPLAFESGT